MKGKRKQSLNGRTRRVFRSFRYTECSAFSSYLHKMSLEGWHFKKWQMGLVFEKGELADITYCVEVFPKGSEMDLKPEKQAEEYSDYCGVAGWELIDGQRKFCIFRRRDSDAPPIVTEQERFENVWKAECRQLALDLILPLFLTVQFWVRALGREFSDWAYFPPYLWILLSVTLMSVGWILQFGRTICWYVRGKQALREGKSVSYEKQPFRRVMEWISTILLEAGLIILFVCSDMPKSSILLVSSILAVLVLNVLILWFRPSRDTNWWIQIAGGVVFALLIVSIGTAVISTENDSSENRKALKQLPLTQLDYCEINGELNYAEYVSHKSIFGSRIQGTVIWLNENQETNELSYEVYRSEYAWVLDKTWQTKRNTLYYRNSEEIDSRTWKALEVRSSIKGMAVCARYEDALLFLFADTPPATDQIEMILEKLEL